MADEQKQSWLAEDLPAQEAADINSSPAHPWTGEPQATVLNDSDAGDDGKDHVVEEVTKGVASVEALEESPTSLQEATTSDSLQDEQQPYGADEEEDDSTAACVNGVGNPETSSHDDPEVAEEREDSVEENPTTLEEEKLSLQEATCLLKLPLEKDLGPLMAPTSMVAEPSSPAGAEAASQDNLLLAGAGENLWLGHDMETGPSPLNAEEVLESGALFESAATDGPCSIESPIHQDGTLAVESAPLESPHSDVESLLTPADLENHGSVQEAADVSQEEPLDHHEEPQPACASEDTAAAKLVEPAADWVEPTELAADREEEQLVPSVAFVSEVEPVPELAICPRTVLDERLLGDLAFELTPPATPQQAEGRDLAQPSCAGTSDEEGALPQPELATPQPPDTPPEREDGAHSLEPEPAGEPIPAGEPAVESTLKPKASSLPQSKTMTPAKTKGAGLAGLAASKRPAGTPVASTSKKPRPEGGVASPATAAKRSPLFTAKSATAAKASPTAGANKDPKGKLAMEGKAVPKPLEKRVATTRISTTTTATTKPATDTPPRAATARMAAKTTTSVLKAPPPSSATAKRTVATGVKGEPKGEAKLAEPKKLTRPSVKLSGARPKVASTAATTDTKGPAPAGASNIARTRPATAPSRHGLGATMSSRNAVVAPTPSGGTERKPAPSSATAARTGPLARASPMANRTLRPTTAPEARAASSRPGAPIENGKPNAVPGRLSKDASARAPARTGVKSTTTKVTVKKVETDGTKPTLPTEVNKSTLTTTKTTVVRTQLKTAGKVDAKNTNVAATNRKPPLEKNTGKLTPKTPTPKKSVGGSKAENHKPSPTKSPSTNGPSDDTLAVENGNVAEQGGGDGVGGHGGSPVRQNGNALSPGVEENANEHHNAPPSACKEEAQSGNPQLEEPIHEQHPQPVEVEQN
ncbi:uncharacterized protein LOC116948739 isoform X2 [Petromyzon marinus]|uniref:uncharacterized protein LOC116948739 isoform X2 n=1 Tax=Petromyzon marinus TaxID=7757 RepID=UPI003F72E57A